MIQTILSSHKPCCILKLDADLLNQKVLQHKMIKQDFLVKTDLSNGNLDHLRQTTISRTKKFFRLIFPGWIFWDGVFAFCENASYLPGCQVEVPPDVGFSTQTCFAFCAFMHVRMHVCNVLLHYTDYIKLHYVISLCCVMLCYAIECNVLQLCNAPEWNVV